MHIDVLNRDISVHEIFFVHDSSMEWNQMLNARDDCFIQGGAHTSNGVFSVSSPNQKFSKLGIEATRHLVTRMSVCIDSDTKS